MLVFLLVRSDFHIAYVYDFGAKILPYMGVAWPTNEINSVRTTKERLDHRLRTTRSAPLRTTRFGYLTENRWKY